jgi:hypothetical protein
MDSGASTYCELIVVVRVGIADFVAISNLSLTRRQILLQFLKVSRQLRNFRPTFAACQGQMPDFSGTFYQVVTPIPQINHVSASTGQKRFLAVGTLNE